MPLTRPGSAPYASGENPQMPHAAGRKSSTDAASERIFQRSHDAGFLGADFFVETIQLYFKQIIAPLNKLLNLSNVNRSVTEPIHFD